MGIYVRKIHWESVGSGNWKPDNWWANIVEAGGDDMQAGNDYTVIPGQSGTLRGGTFKKVDMYNSESMWRLWPVKK